MSTFLKTTLTATLAASVLLIMDDSKLVRAESSPSTNGSKSAQVQDASPVASISIHSTVRHLAEPLQNSFDPEPNDPPKGTGGSGTR